MGEDDYNFFADTHDSDGLETEELLFLLDEAEHGLYDDEEDDEEDGEDEDEEDGEDE